METPAINRAVQVLINPTFLARRQRDDSHSGEVRKSLCGGSGTGAREVDTVDHGLDDNDVIRYAEGKDGKLPAIPKSMVADVLAWVQNLHGHAGVGVTLTLVLDHFYWPSVTRNTR